MCCANDNCNVRRCRGAAGTDWSAFTWYWQNPDGAETSYNGDKIARRFAAQSSVMVDPGVCQCLWLVGGNDRGRDLLGTMNPIGQYFGIPSIGALQYVQNGLQSEWQVKLTRWLYGFSWDSSSKLYGTGWGWNEDGFGQDCGGAFGNFAGVANYGWNGLGWGYLGVPAGWPEWLGVTLEQQIYRLPGNAVMDVRGDVNRFLPQSTEAKWPAWIDLRRVAKNGVPG